MAAPARVRPGHKTKAFIQAAGNWQEADQNFVQKEGVGVTFWIEGGKLVCNSCVD
jgi:hypothetical protein